MEVKPGYKRTEVGVIPEEWEVSTVGSEFEIQLGKMLDAEKNAGVPKPYLGNRAIQWDRIDIRDLPTVPMSPTDTERFRLREGDLLVCEGGEVGRAAIWDAPIRECYYQKALHRLRPLRGFDVRLMVALLRLWSECGLLLNYVTQTSIAHLPREKFLGVPMPVPPPCERKAIAEALSDVDALLGALDRLIAKKRDLKQAAMQQLLTGQTRLPGFHGEWEVLPLSELLNFRNGVNADKLAYGSGVRFANVLEVITKSHLTESDIPGRVQLKSALVDSYEVRRGDLLFNRTSETDEEIGLGSVYLGGETIVFGGFVIRGRPRRDNLDAVYSGYAFRAQALRVQVIAKGQGGIRANIGQADLGQVVMSLPGLPEQRAIAEILFDVDAELAALEQRREKTRFLKQAMMQELLTGRTRLV